MEKVRRNAVDLDARRSRIVEVAADLFREKGLRNISMNDIANATDLAKPVLYRAFSSREALEIAIFEPVIQLIRTARNKESSRPGAHVFTLYEQLKPHQSAALLVLRDCRVSPAHAHWFKRSRQIVAERLWEAFRPTLDAPKGGGKRGRLAALWMSSFYVETLAGWLQNEDGLTDQQRVEWITDVVRAWWTAARREYQLGEVDFDNPPAC